MPRKTPNPSKQQQRKGGEQSSREQERNQQGEFAGKATARKHAAPQDPGNPDRDEKRSFESDNR